MEDLRRLNLWRVPQIGEFDEAGSWRAIRKVGNGSDVPILIVATGAIDAPNCVSSDPTERLVTMSERHDEAGKPGRQGDQLALVTGASSGIGRAFARRLGADGYNLVVVGRRRERLEELVSALPNVRVRPLVADLGTDAGVEVVAEVCAREALTMLVNNAGVAHYMPFAELPAGKANELLHVKAVAPAMLALATVPGMVARGAGTIINVSGMLAFSATAPLVQLPLRRAVYAGTLAHIVALSQALHEELKSQGLQIQALCPGVVATEFHERQGIDLSAFPRMSADDVVTASLRGLASGEVVCAPGVERSDLLDAVFKAGQAAFGAQSPQLATRYRTP
jgi:uncharacterized protein